MRHERDVELVAQVGECSVRTRRAAPPDLDVAEGQIVRRDRIRHGVRVDAQRIETDDEAGSQHVAPRKGPVVVGLEDAQLGEQVDVFRSRPRSLRDLICGETIAHFTYELGSAWKASWQVCEQK